MWFKKKKLPPTPITVAEQVALDIRLNDMIKKWVIFKIPTKGVSDNSKINELIIFNFKTLYEDNDTTEQMRKFLISTGPFKKDADFTFSQIQDLYINICMSFPHQFIANIHNTFVETIASLGYDIDEGLVNDFEFGWLMAKIQFEIRFLYSKTTVMPG